MLYLDTSVLAAYTLAREKEKKRFVATSALIEKIDKREYKALTSFYSLLELFTIAYENAPDFEVASQDAKDVLIEVLQTRVAITRMLTREEKLTRMPQFRLIKDSTDIPHAISAFLFGCDKIVTYDEHFQAINHILPVVTPEDLL